MWQGFDVPVWIWVVIIIVPLFIAQFLAHRQLWVELEKQKQSNWISAHEMERGELPPVPSFMSDVVSNYSPGMLVSKNIQLITPSAHFWEKRRPSEKKQLLELAEWLGQDPRDYEARIKEMS